jgi:uncharacterized protein
VTGQKRPPINTFSQHYRQKYGKPVGKIPIDIGLPCPNRLLGGCIFCGPAGFTPGYLDHNDAIATQIFRGKKQLLRDRFRLYHAYFQQESCTALPPAQLLDHCRRLLADPDCIGLILSTRPDMVPDGLLSPLAELIAGCGKECLFELGMQTAHGYSLKLLNRNHTMADVTDGVCRIRAVGPFGIGLHLIFGIPGESEEQMLHSLDVACSLGIDALKLHHLQVLHDTPLAAMYARGEVETFTLEGYMDFLIKAIPRIPAKVVIHRFWATSHPKLLIAPKWHILATHLSRELMAQVEARDLSQGSTAIL